MRIALGLLFTSTLLHAAEPNLFGDWREPGGAVIRISPCGAEVCASIMNVTPGTQDRLDLHNPDPAQQNRPLCGLVIGNSFHLNGADRASNGTLYDPRSGRTFRGEMVATPNELHLRGYVGLRLFGRSQVWTRASSVEPCAA